MSRGAISGSALREPSRCRAYPAIPSPSSTLEQGADAERGGGGEGEGGDEFVEVEKAPPLDQEPTREGQRRGREDGGAVADLEGLGRPAR